MKFRDGKLSQLPDEFHAFRTPGRSTVTSAPAFYNQHIVAPAADFLPTRYNDQHLNVDFTMDNHLVYDSPGVFRPCNRYVVVPIWFLLSSAHCLPRLDLQRLRSFKSHWANLYTQPTQPLLEGKIVPTLHAWHYASYAGVECNAWRLAAIRTKRQSDPYHSGVGNLRAAAAVMCKSCSELQAWKALGRRSI